MQMTQFELTLFLQTNETVFGLKLFILHRLFKFTVLALNFMNFDHIILRKLFTI